MIDQPRLDASRALAALGVTADLSAGDLPVCSPIDGDPIARLAVDGADAVNIAIAAAAVAFRTWQLVPPPRRGELIRRFGEALRAAKEPLAALITVETGKILAEARGEVQEMIDICDFAVGLSRQLYGLTIASERPGHRMMETWHPLGPVGVITAFNFPAAVWSWNFAIAIVCGDPVLWKPSEKAPLTAIACRALFERVRRDFGDDAPAGLLSLLIGGAQAGEHLARSPDLRLISATGSCRMGHTVAPLVAARFGRLLLELGGNNGAVVMPSADLDLTVRAVVFAAVGTAGQRCTTLRRLIVHEDVYAPVVKRLKAAYGALSIGDPRDPAVLVGPLIDAAAFQAMEDALAAAIDAGGVVFGGERRHEVDLPQAWYARPALVEMPQQTAIVREETFAPILYVLPCRDLEEAIALHNDVPQGLASSIFTRDLNEAERFLSASGSDCGIVNVNIGPSGAEIGGAFGGEKDSGGGREAGSDAWKAYMRRATNTINASATLPLAQGVEFRLG